MSDPPRVVVSQLTVSDRPRVAGILRSTENFREDEVDVALELFDESFAGEDYAFLGAFDARGSQPTDEPRPTTGAALIGFACFGPSLGCDRTYDLYWIAVDRRAQGTGCGSQLLEEVERRLEALHARMLVVETSSRSDYAATRAFYLRRGYVEAARVREFYAPADDRVILTKRLEGSPRRGWGAVA